MITKICENVRSCQDLPISEALSFCAIYVVDHWLFRIFFICIAIGVTINTIIQNDEVVDVYGGLYASSSLEILKIIYIVCAPVKM